METLARLRYVLVVLTAALGLLAPSAAVAAPYHGVNAWFNFSNMPYGTTGFVENRVNVTRNAPYQYYATYWKYKSGGDGYMGLQSNGRMPVTNQTTNLFRFSLWGGNGYRNLRNGTRCARFGHEGKGIECAMPFWFSTNRWYVYQVKDAGSDAYGRWWEASIKDEPTGRWFSLGQIRTPYRSSISEVAQFTESFQQPRANDCWSIRRSEVVMVVPFASPYGKNPGRHSQTWFPNNPCANGSAATGYGAIAMRMGR
jgi:hypothetical protein